MNTIHLRFELCRHRLSLLIQTLSPCLPLKDFLCDKLSKFCAILNKHVSALYYNTVTFTCVPRQRENRAFTWNKTKCHGDTGKTV